MNKYKLISVIVFLAMIFSTAVITILKPDKSFSETENRYLQQKPKLTKESLLSGEFSQKFDKYLSDQFIMRDDLIGIKTQAEYVVGKKDTNDVYFSKDGYLIEKHSEIDNDMLLKNIDRLKQFVEDNKAMVMLVPTASNILSDKLPPFADTVDQDKMIEDVQKAVGKENFIDIRGILSEKNDEYIYYKTDHHWTALGAYYAYTEYCYKVGIEDVKHFSIDEVTNSFYGTIYSKARLFSTKPDKMYKYSLDNQDFEVIYNMGQKTTDTLYDESFLEKKDKYSYYLGGNNPLVVIKNKNQDNGKKLLVIKDSYAHSFVPFVANDYSEVHMLDLRYLNISMAQYIEENEITDSLFLFNTMNFAREETLAALNN